MRVSDCAAELSGASWARCRLPPTAELREGFARAAARVRPGAAIGFDRTRSTPEELDGTGPFMVRANRIAILVRREH